MTFLGSTKLLQGGFPDIWQKSIRATASTSAPVFWSSTIVKAITSWIASSVGMKPGFIIMNQKPNGRACNGSISFQKIQVSALCWKAFVDGVLRLPRAYPWALYGERCHSNKCQLLQHVKKWTEAGYLLKAERKVGTGCSAVTRQCMPSYGTPDHQHNSATELGSSWAPCLQLGTNVNYLAALALWLTRWGHNLMWVPVYHTLPPHYYWSALPYQGTHPSPATLIFIFHIAAWELMHLKKACLIREHLHKVLIIAVIYKLNVFTDEPGSLDPE